MTPWVHRLIVANIIVFFLQSVAGVERLLEFVPAFVLYRPWTIVTYMFLHGGIIAHPVQHARPVLLRPARRGTARAKRFITLYLLSGIVGALFSFIFAPYAPIIGASAAVFGVMLAFARFWPACRSSSSSSCRSKPVSP